MLLSRAITKVDKNSKAPASVLNTLERNVIITSSNISFLPFPKESIILGSNLKIDRNQMLTNSLRTDHLNSEEKQNLYKICTQFSNSFYLEEDKLTSTQTTNHQINTKESNPINVKSYRYPQIH